MLQVDFHRLSYLGSARERWQVFYPSNVHRISSKSKFKVEKNPEEGLNEDEDVQMERTRVKNALSTQSHEEVSRGGIISAVSSLTGGSE